jgi:hypothetical protein
MGRNSFEGASDQSIDIDNFHAMAIESVADHTFNEDAFMEPYGQQTIMDDKREVLIRKSKFKGGDSEYEVQNKKVADIFEAEIVYQGEQANWFGGSAVITKTSEYDDVVNNVDAVIEFKNLEEGSSSHLGIATDVTFSSDNTKKFDGIKKKIERGTLSKVKYFHSEFTHYHGQLSSLPEVVIGVEKGTILEVAELWKGNKNKALAQHKIQIMMLQQILAQLEVNAIYADSIKQNKVAAVFRDRLVVIQRIFDEKRDIYEKVKLDLMSDNIHADIMNYCKRLKAAILKDAGVKIS